MGARRRKDGKIQEKDGPKKHEQQQNKNERATNQTDYKDEKPGIPFKRMAVRFTILVVSMLALNLYTKWKGIDTFASHQDHIDRRSVDVPCSKDYDEEKNKFSRCIPRQCRRVVMDEIVDQRDSEKLLRMAKAGLALGGSNGGASILDIHSGALSKGSQFVNIFRVMEDSGNPVFTDEDFSVYRKVKNQIHTSIAKEFGISKSSLYLTKPTFFSRMTNKAAHTIHDEYWHLHVDKVTYGSFHYTSLLYLSTYNKDFKGGRFVFVDQNRNSTVEPKLGRVSFFTSGSENPHYVEQIESGTRYAITISFTCDADKAISDPVLNKQ